MPRKKILWLCSWYPGRSDPFNGDFIQRHARAASLYDDIYVIHVASEEKKGKTIRAFEEKTVTGSLKEHIIYTERASGPFSKFINYYRTQRQYKRAIAAYTRKFNYPDLVHVHVPIPAGIAGLKFSGKNGIPMVLTEHWGIYNEVVPDNFRSRGRIFRRLLARVFRSAKIFTSVSRYLGEQVNQQVLSSPYRVIPNTVDTSYFFYKETSTGPFRFIHVSNMVPLKNTEGLLKAFLTLAKEHPVQLVMVGDTLPEHRALAESLGLLDKSVFFKGEVSYPEVAAHMQESNCLLLFSHIENSPCVIAEALCCGLPVIATRVGGIPELINSSNGLLVQPGDEAGLAAGMLEMMQNYNSFDRQGIANRSAGIFSFTSVGKQFSDLYREFV